MKSWEFSSDAFIFGVTQRENKCNFQFDNRQVEKYECFVMVVGTSRNLQFLLINIVEWINMI